MEISRFVTPKHRDLLKKARDTYGDTTQILVSVEELCELACVCAKFPRYENPDLARSKLHDRIVDEIADSVAISNQLPCMCFKFCILRFVSNTSFYVVDPLTDLS